jgi:hypothetical protein
VSQDQFGGAARRISTAPAVHSAGQVVGLDHVLTKDPVVAEAGAEGSPVRARGGGRWWPPRRAAVPVRGEQHKAMCDPRRCYGSLGRCSRVPRASRAAACYAAAMAGAVERQERRWWARGRRAGGLE